LNRLSSLILITLYLLLNSCGTERAEETSVEPTTVYPDQESWNATIRITKDGKTVGLLKSGHIQKYNATKTTLLKDGLHVDFYDNLGNHTSVLTSEGGKVLDDKQDMEAFGNVVVVSDSGIVLYTDTLKWNNKDQKIYSEIAVKIVSEESDTLYGDSFKSDPDLTNYEIVNPHGKSSKMLKIE